MKVYQERWAEKLRTCKSNFTLIKTCLQILKDDTGHTDELATALASAIIRSFKKH
jgi:hypothetical protein